VWRVCARARRTVHRQTDAVGFAVSEAARTNARLMYEAHDERGRIIGERLLLRTAASI
jgi:hypothetical protein